MDGPWPACRTGTAVSATDAVSVRLPRAASVLLAAAGLTVALAGVRAAAGIIGPAVLALVLTITVHPIRRRMVRRGFPDWLVATAMMVAVYVLLLAVTVSVAYAIGRLAAILPAYTDDLQKYVDDASAWLKDHGIGQKQVDAASGAVDFGGLVSVASSIFGAVLGLASNLFFIVMVVLFMCFDTASTQRALDQVRTIKPDLVDALGSFAQGTRMYMAVSAGFGLIVAVIDGLALWLMGVPGAFVWAVLAFVTNFIPNIGFIIGLVPPAVIGLLEGGPGLMLGVVAVYCVANLVIQSIIQPRYVGDSVGLSPTITMLSLVFWAWAIGALGALLAVPLSLLMRALLIEADPSAHWALPLISGRLDETDDEAEPETEPETEPVAGSGTGLAPGSRRPPAPAPAPEH